MLKLTLNNIMSTENVIKIKEEFDLELQNEWEKFEKISNISFFQTFKWQKYWHEKCGNNRKIIISLFYKKKELVAIFPFNLEKKYYINILNWNGFPFSDYNQPIIKTNHSFNTKDFEFLISEIFSKHKFDNVHLINCIVSSYLDNSKFISNKASKLIFNKSNTDNLIINYLKKKIIYEENRLKKKFILEINIDSNDEKEKILNFFINEKYKQLERTSAWNYLAFKEYKKYIYDLLEFDQKHLCFSCLKIDNKIISSHIGYKFNNCYYYIFPVYDLNYKKYSPGNILLSKLIENYKHNKFRAFDFTVGDEVYKNKLNNFITYTYEYISYTKFLGIFYYLKIKLKKMIKLLILKKNL